MAETGRSAIIIEKIIGKILDNKALSLLSF